MSSGKAKNDKILPFSTLAGLGLQLGVLLALRLTAGIYGRNDKGAFPDGEVKKLGRLPAEFLQTEVCIIRLWVAVRD